MASAPNTTRSSAQQPGLRSFIIYDQLPDGLAAWPVTDNSAQPHLRPGDFVIVDPTDQEPAQGEIYLVQFKSAREPSLAAMFEHRSGWKVGDVSARPIFGEDGARSGPVARWVDGPWPIGYVHDITLGRVVGLLEQKFEEPRRLMVA